MAGGQTHELLLPERRGRFEPQFLRQPPPELLKCRERIALASGPVESFHIEGHRAFVQRSISDQRFGGRDGFADTPKRQQQLGSAL